jgi:hypothetical protein
MPVTTSTAISTLRTLRRIEQPRETPSRPEPGCALWISGTSDICLQEGRPLGDVKTIGRWPRRRRPRRCRSASSEPAGGTTWAPTADLDAACAPIWSIGTSGQGRRFGEPPRRRRDKRHLGAPPLRIGCAFGALDRCGPDCAGEYWNRRSVALAARCTAGPSILGSAARVTGRP